MSSSSGAGRLRREYKSLQQQPLPYVAVRPDGDNLFLWYFLIHNLPKDTPYFGGFYLGKLEMPSIYPFEPPSITMITPSGRFETNVKVCTSFTSYHKETWSPLWRIETLLMGFISFMLGASREWGVSADTATFFAQISGESFPGFNRDFLETQEARRVAFSYGVSLVPEVQKAVSGLCRARLEERRLLQRVQEATRSGAECLGREKDGETVGAARDVLIRMPAAHALLIGFSKVKCLVALLASVSLLLAFTWVSSLKQVRFQLDESSKL